MNYNQRSLVKHVHNRILRNLVFFIKKNIWIYKNLCWKLFIALLFLKKSFLIFSKTFRLSLCCLNNSKTVLNINNMIDQGTNSSCQYKKVCSWSNQVSRSLLNWLKVDCVYILFIERKKGSKVFGPRTWCTKNLSIIESHTTDTF